MRSRALPFTFALVSISLACVGFASGCGDSGSDGAGGGGNGDECSADEVSVEYLGGPDDGRIECFPIPDECGGTVACDGEQACAAATYDLCESPYFGVGCSALEGHASIISCND
jgi:hypothetical protein